MKTSWNTHREQRCKACDGRGYTKDGRRYCDSCTGAGVVVVERFPEPDLRPPWLRRKRDSAH